MGRRLFLPVSRQPILRRLFSRGLLLDVDVGLLEHGLFHACLLYTSDAADEGLGVDLGGRRIIKKKRY